MSRKFTIYILLYNSEKSTNWVFDEIDKFDVNYINQIYLVDNKSLDNTIEKCKERRAISHLKEKIKLLCNNNNYGMGGSLKNCIENFKSNSSNEFMCILHSNGKGINSKIFNSFVNEYKNNLNVDFLTTTRFSKSTNLANYPKSRVYGNYIFNLITFILSGKYFTDSGSGLVLIKRDLLKDVNLDDLTNGPQFNPMLNIFLKAKSKNFKEIPIDWREGKLPSNISVLTYSIELLKILTKYFIFSRVLKRKNYWKFKSLERKYTLI